MSPCLPQLFRRMLGHRFAVMLQKSSVGDKKLHQTLRLRGGEQTRAEFFFFFGEPYLLLCKYMMTSHKYQDRFVQLQHQ